MKSRSIAAAVVLAAAGPPALAQDARTMDGWGNNLNDLSMGAAGTTQLRLTDPVYAGLNDLRSGPDARVVSNTIGVQTASGNAAGLSAMFWQWGQFIDHDMVLTEGGGAFAPMFAPVGDPVFPAGAMIPFTRSLSKTDGSGTPQYANHITSFLDGSMVYGSDDIRGSALRAYSGGRLATDAGGFMPLNTGGMENANEGFLPDQTMFLGGDVRANEQAGLTALHTIFVREHNTWADRLATENAGWDDERIYQTARKIVGAEVQAITYNEWLPSMLGDGALGDYTGYDSSVDASVSLEFSTAAFRFGHTMLNEELWRLNEDGTPFDGGNLTLHQNFFNPSTITGAGALEALMRGMSAQEAEELDTQMIDGVRNMLFGDPGHGGMDLMAANLMRGRDHGIGTYNDIREAMGLIRLSDWADVTSDGDLAAKLASLYGSTDELDAWVGMVAEDHLDGAIVGETLFAVLGDQFDRVRAGDRFFYLNDPELEPWLADIAGTTLGDVIARNTDIGGFGGSVFYATVPAPSGVGVLAVGGLLATRRRRG
ncbi:MAG: peroxidase family protein [Phycisphaerales bacterium]